MNYEKIIFDTPVKVYFKEFDQHDAMIGKFVKLADVNDLERKSMVRFVNAGKEERFENSKPETKGFGHQMYTRIYETRLFTQMVTTDGSKIIY